MTYNSLRILCILPAALCFLLMFINAVVKAGVEEHRQREQEARRREKAEAEARAREKRAAQAAARTAAKTACPPKKRGRPRKNPTAEASKPVKTTEVIPKPETNAAKTGAFAGETVAFTGSCPKLQRRHMISHTERLGGKGYETINTRCTLLVVGEKPGRNQLDRAARWNVPTITWEEWWKCTFDAPATVKPQITAPALVTLEQFAALIENTGAF